MNTQTYEISDDPATVSEWKRQGVAHPITDADAEHLQGSNRAERRTWLREHGGFKKGPLTPAP